MKTAQELIEEYLVKYLADFDIKFQNYSYQNMLILGKINFFDESVKMFEPSPWCSQQEIGGVQVVFHNSLDKTQIKIITKVIEKLEWTK